MFILCALAAASTGAVHGAILHTVDADHALADQSAVTEYEQSGLVATNLSTPQMSVTIAEKRAACDRDDSLTDSVRDKRYHYLCFDYYGEVKQTTRIHIPEGYWHPYIRDGKEPLGDGPTASFRSVGNASYTSVEMTFEGRGTAVYAIPKDATASYWAIERINDRTERVGGITLWSSGTSWQTINQSAFAENPAVELKTVPDRTVVQYDTTPEQETAAWAPVPEDKDATAPVYVMQPADANKTLYVVSKRDNPPQVRYRVRGTGLGRVDAAIDQLRTIDEQVQSYVDSVTDALPDILGG